LKKISLVKIINGSSVNIKYISRISNK